MKYEHLIVFVALVLALMATSIDASKPAARKQSVELPRSISDAMWVKYSRDKEAVDSAMQNLDEAREQAHAAAATYRRHRNTLQVLQVRLAAATVAVAQASDHHNALALEQLEEQEEDLVKKIKQVHVAEQVVDEDEKAVAVKTSEAARVMAEADRKMEAALAAETKLREREQVIAAAVEHIKRRMEAAQKADRAVAAAHAAVVAQAKAVEAKHVAVKSQHAKQVVRAQQLDAHEETLEALKKKHEQQVELAKAVAAAKRAALEKKEEKIAEDARIVKEHKAAVLAEQRAKELEIQRQREHQLAMEAHLASERAKELAKRMEEIKREKARADERKEDTKENLDEAVAAAKAKQGKATRK